MCEYVYMYMYLYVYVSMRIQYMYTCSETSKQGCGILGVDTVFEFRDVQCHS